VEREPLYESLRVTGSHWKNVALALVPVGGDVETLIPTH